MTDTNEGRQKRSRSGLLRTKRQRKPKKLPEKNATPMQGSHPENWPMPNPVRWLTNTDGEQSAKKDHPKHWQLAQLSALSIPIILIALIILLALLTSSCASTMPPGQTQKENPFIQIPESLLSKPQVPLPLKPSLPTTPKTQAAAPLTPGN